MRPRLRVSHPGQRVPCAQAWHQNGEERHGKGNYGYEDEFFNSKSDSSGAKGSLWNKKRLRRLTHNTLEMSSFPKVNTNYFNKVFLDVDYMLTWPRDVSSE